MYILLKFCVALAAMNILGFGLAGFLAQGLNVPRRILTLPLGYAASLLLYQALLRSTWNLSLSLTITCAALGALSMAYLFVAHRWQPRQFPRFAIPDNERLALWGALALVVLFAMWPHMVSGWESYWHSGNPDILDPLYSRDILIGFAKHLHAAPGSPEWLDPKVLENYLKSLDEYFRYPIHLQYTSMVFWSYVLQSFAGIDVFLIQAVLNLMLMTHGAYALMRISLESRPTAALLGAIGCSACTFYFTTFINGHEGSMMFMALIPYLLLVTLQWSRAWAVFWRQTAIVAIFIGYLGITYPFPLVFFLLPLALHALYTGFLAPRGGLAWAWAWWKSRSPLCKALLLAVLLAALAGGFFVVWRLTGPVRLRAVIQFRSWRLMETLYRDVLFWGLWPSPVAFGQSGHVNFINLIRSAPLLGWPLTILTVGWAWAMYALTALWAYRLRNRMRPYYLIFLLLWPLLFLAMRYLIIDPYFLYKYTYTTQFILIIVLVHGWHSYTQESTRRFTRNAALMVVPVWLALNLTNDAIGSYSLLKRPYNQDFASYRAATILPRETIARTWVLIPLLDHREIMLYALRNHGLNTCESPVEAEYVLAMKGYRDILTTNLDTSKPIWENDRFALYPNQTNNTVGLHSNIAVELMSLKNEAMLPFRWVSDEEAFNIPGGFLASYGNVARDVRFLRFCVESGPSFDYRPFTLNVIARGGMTENFDIFDPNFTRSEQSRAFMSLHPNARTCFWIDLKDLEGHTQPFHFAPDHRGKSMLPFDERKLDFKLAQLGLTAERYDRQGLLFLTAARDIVPPACSRALHAGEELPAPAVLLGNGWYQAEQQGRDIFRWAEKDAEILVFNSAGVPIELTLEMECGPGLVGRGATLTAQDEDGKDLWTGPLGGRTEARFTVPPTRGRVGVVRLAPSAVPDSLPDDPRRLSFRVFRIGLTARPGGAP